MTDHREEISDIVMRQQKEMIALRDVQLHDALSVNEELRTALAVRDAEVSPKCPGCGARISSGSGKCDWCNAFDRKCAEHIAVREEQQYFGGSV